MSSYLTRCSADLKAAIRHMTWLSDCPRPLYAELDELTAKLIVECGILEEADRMAEGFPLSRHASHRQLSPIDGLIMVAARHPLDWQDTSEWKETVHCIGEMQMGNVEVIEEPASMGFEGEPRGPRGQLYRYIP